MKVYDNIVVGLDISKGGIAVLKRAFLLAKQNNSKVTIVHAIDGNWFSELFSSKNLKELQEHAKKSIETELEELDTKGVEYSILVDKDTPSNFVVDTAKKLNASLVIIGVNEKENKNKPLLGSTAHKIAQNSKIPMIIVKNNCDEDYQNMVTFTDLSEVSYKSLVFAKEFFKKEEIKTVYAYKQMSEIAFEYYNEADNKEKIKLGIKQKEEAKFNEFVKEHNLKNSEILESDLGINTALMDYVAKNENDLVVLGSKGLSSSTTLFFGSTTSYLMENLQSDLLIYVPQK
jgi:nucleotide-binding universal stress UspA family protein